MLTVIKHLPRRPLDASQSNNLTPDEVTAWLDEREWREQMRRRQQASLNVAFWLIATVLLLVTIGFFTH